MCDVITAADYMYGITKRDHNVVGYAETTRGDVASSADLRGNTVTYQMTGKSPQGEDDTMATAQRFVDWLNKQGANWGAPEEYHGPFIDAVSKEQIDNSGAVLYIQVVRAIVNDKVWSKFSKDGIFSGRAPISAIAKDLSGAIKKKTDRIPSDKKQKITLLIDANRSPGHAFPVVIKEFKEEYGAIIERFGFKSVYVAAYSADLVYRLDSTYRDA